MPKFASVFTVLGVLVFLSELKRLVGFLWFHFLRPTSWTTYLQGPAPYALITGATDGIGKGIAKDLHRKGFNLILHGRSEAKMARVVEELREQNPNGPDIKTFLADATKDGNDFEGIAKNFERLNTTIVVMNVGGSYMKPHTIDGWHETEATETVRWNVLFPTLLTRALLPSLRRTSRQRPVLVSFVGSFAGSNPMPRLALYSASKAFIRRVSHNLHVDERFEDASARLAFMYVEVMAVSSGSMTAPVTWMCPAADEYAKTVVQSFGSGRQEVTPYIGHAVPLFFMRFVPMSVRAMIIKEEMLKVLELEAKKE